MYLRQQLSAPNDKNGNPRRVWVLFWVEDGRAHFVASFDEGYYGDPVHTDRAGAGWNASSKLPGVNVDAAEYRRFINWGKVVGQC